MIGKSEMLIVLIVVLIICGAGKLPSAITDILGAVKKGKKDDENDKNEYKSRKSKLKTINIDKTTSAIKKVPSKKKSSRGKSKK